ncbi:MAG: DUF5690 family protein, partial [Bacteroidota bacterium]
MRSSLTSRLQQAPEWAFAVYATLAAFCAYASMYAFRKAFTAAPFAEGPVLLGLSYKSALVILQVFGYMLSKFIGIKVVSEMGTNRRGLAILVLIGIAWAALLGFALVPAPYNAIFLFFNGLPLGMIWGLVFSYLEGRRQTEILGLGLCASFIFASGLVKDVGRMLMENGVSEFWMPFLVGLIFVLPLCLCVWLLEQLPLPSPEDEALRTKRAPMSGSERKAFFRRFAAGLIALIAVYTVLSAYRDFRDNFMADIWQAATGTDSLPNFSGIEVPVSLGVLGLLMLLVLIKDNRQALRINQLTILLGVLAAGLSTWGFQQGWIGPYGWLLGTGFGTYMAYIPFNSILFDRMIAAFGQV